MSIPLSEVLYKEEEISSALSDLAEKLNRHCAGKEWVGICVLNGGLVFTGHLFPRLSFDMRQDYVRVSRYQDNIEGKELSWRAQPETLLKEKNVLLFDDIFDEGKTLKAVMEYCKLQGAGEVVSVVLIEKNHGRKVENFRPDYVGLSCPDIYVYGFGMDYKGLYRNLPEIRMVGEKHN